MTVVRGFGIVLCSAAGFGAGGALVGYALAHLTPAYYETVLVRGESSRSIDQVGVGLGLTQGVLAGLVVGSVVVLAVALSARRQAAGGTASGE
jgi:hypothetical protein